MSMITKIDKFFYPGFGPNWDDLLFRNRILNLVELNTRILDLGAGAGIVEQMVEDQRQYRRKSSESQMP